MYEIPGNIMFWKAEYVGNLIFGPVIISMMLLYLASVSLEPPQCLLHQRAVLKPPHHSTMFITPKSSPQTAPSSLFTLS